MDSYFRGLSLPPVLEDVSCENLTIGIADSLKRPQNLDEVDVHRRVDSTDKEATDPTGHGTKVFDIISHYLPNSKYCFYRYIGGKGEDERRVSRLIEAIDEARIHDVDLLNISGGVDYPDYNPDSVI